MNKPNQNLIIMDYYYIDNNEQKGPFTFDELGTRSIRPSTLVWHQGLSDWTEARNVEALNGLFGTPPPPPAPKLDHSGSETPKYRASNPVKPTNVEATKSHSNRAMWITLIAVLALGLVVAAIYLSSSSGSSHSGDDVSFGQTELQNPENDAAPPQLTEAETKDNLFQIEASKPTNYLTTDGTYRVNLASNTIVEGTIYNNASIAGFKNINLVAKFYSKTDVLLGEDRFLVMDFVEPMGNLSFKHKIQGWWSEIDHWTLTVTSAESY